MTSEFKPDYAVAPGRTIEECIRERGMTVKEFAASIGETLDDLVDVIEARSPITEDLAVKLEKLGPPSRFWLNMQDNYDSTVYRLFFERVRKKPNLFAHFTDDQLEALQALFQSVDGELMPDRDQEKDFYLQVDFLMEQMHEEFCRRFFPETIKPNISKVNF